MMIIVINDKNCPKHLITATSIIIYLFPVMMNETKRTYKLVRITNNTKNYTSFFIYLHSDGQKVSIIRWEIEKEEDSQVNVLEGNFVEILNINS